MVIMELEKVENLTYRPIIVHVHASSQDLQFASPAEAVNGLRRLSPPALICAASGAVERTPTHQIPVCMPTQTCALAGSATNCSPLITTNQEIHEDAPRNHASEVCTPPAAHREPVVSDHRVDGTCISDASVETPSNMPDKFSMAGRREAVVSTEQDSQTNELLLVQNVVGWMLKAIYTKYPPSDSTPAAKAAQLLNKNHRAEITVLGKVLVQYVSCLAVFQQIVVYGELVQGLREAFCIARPYTGSPPGSHPHGLLGVCLNHVFIILDELRIRQRQNRNCAIDKLSPSAQGKREVMRRRQFPSEVGGNADPSDTDVTGAKCRRRNTVG